MRYVKTAVAACTTVVTVVVLAGSVSLNTAASAATHRTQGSSPTLPFFNIDADSSAVRSPCSIDGSGGTRKCVGVIAAQDEPPPIDSLEDIFGDEEWTFVRGAGADRKTTGTKCTNNPKCLTATTYVNPDVGAIDLQHLNDKALILAAIRWSKGAKYGDKKYSDREDVGRGLDRQFERRTFFIVRKATQAELGTHVADGRVVAHWTLYKIDRRTFGFDRVQNLREGVIVACEYRHKDPPISAFYTCPQADIVHEAAARLTLPFTFALRVRECVRSESGLARNDLADCRRARQVWDDRAAQVNGRATDPSTAAPTAVELATLIDTDDSPYWFSCSSGCCTADII